MCFEKLVCLVAKPASVFNAVGGAVRGSLEGALVGVLSSGTVLRWFKRPWVDLA